MGDTTMLNEPACVSEEELAAYVGGRLDAAGISHVEAHLARCGGCRERSLLLARAEMELDRREDAGWTPSEGALRRFESLIERAFESNDTAPRDPVTTVRDAEGPSAAARPASRSGQDGELRRRRPRRRLRRSAAALLGRAFLAIGAAAAAAAVFLVARNFRQLAPGPEPEGTIAETGLQETPRTGASFGRLAALEGVLEHLRPGVEMEGRVEAGTVFLVGDSLRTGSSLARVRVDSGSVLYVNRSTTVTFEESGPPARVSVAAGEVYAETAASDGGFRIRTPHGEAVDLGTRFGVGVTQSGTAVLVAEGRVQASTEAGRADLAGAQEVLLASRASAPGPVREVADVRARLAWALEGPVAETPAEPAPKTAPEAGPAVVDPAIPEEAARPLPESGLILADDFNGSPVGEWPRGWRRPTSKGLYRAAFVVFDEGTKPGERFLGCLNQPEHTTQHAYLPVADGDWAGVITISAALRLSGERNVRAGFQLDKREPWTLVSIEYDATRKVLSARTNDARDVGREDWRTVQEVSFRLEPGRS